MSYVDPRGTYHEESREPLFIPRITPQPPPSVAVDDPTDAVCVRINAQWVKHVAGYLYGLTRYDAWDGTEAEVLFARQQAMNLLSLIRKGSDCEASMSCQDVLDCLEDEPAWQQISNSASSDLSLSNEQIEQITQEQSALREAQYDGTPASIMNDPTYDDTSDDWNNNAGWCEAATAWVQAVFAAKIRQLDQMAGIAQIASLLLTGLKTLSGGGWLLNLAGWGLLPLDLFTTYNRDAMYHLLTDPQILFHTVDGIVRENGSKDITFAGYQQLTANGYAWRDTTYQGMAFIKQWLNAEVLQHPIQAEKNYQLLLQAVHTANYHKEALGDPMWCARSNSWTMKRGKGFATTGVQTVIGTQDTTNGFTYHASGINRTLDMVIASPTPTVFQSYALSAYNRTQSPIRPTELTIMNNGLVEYQNTNNYPNNSSYYYNINTTGSWLRFRADFEESGQWTLDPPFYAELLTVTGNDQPPVGYWTPD